jgi:hypothetical protein
MESESNLCDERRRDRKLKTAPARHRHPLMVRETFRRHSDARSDPGPARRDHGQTGTESATARIDAFD